MFEELQKEIKACRRCEKEFGFEPIPIVSGDKNAKIVQISQAPSSNVHKTGIPFNDKSGDTLKYKWYQITDEIFYNTRNFYITSLAHCYPGKKEHGGDRLPPKCCYQIFIKKELELINNKLYIIIGAASAKVLFPSKSFEELVFNNQILNNKLAIILPHPSPLNFRWIKNHPDFLNKRIHEVRKIIYNCINEGE